MAIYGMGIGKCDKHDIAPEWDLGGRLYCPRCRSENMDKEIERANQEKSAAARFERVVENFKLLCFAPDPSMPFDPREWDLDYLWDQAERIESFIDGKRKEPK